MNTKPVIENIIRTASDIVHSMNRELKRDAFLQGLLVRYDAAIEDSRACMQQLELGKLCSSCATNIHGGGCCGIGIDDWYDHYLVLMNLLLGVNLPTRRHDPEGCYFLGPEGCVIKARYHFCVNYLCYRIHEKYSRHELARLVKVSGKELYLSWLVEMRLREMGI